MKLTPQTYQDSTLTDAIAAGCDVVQPKYRGRWCRVEISRRYLRVYDAFREDIHGAIIDQEAPCCTLIGDFFGPPRAPDVKIIVWDCWALCHQPEDAVRLETTYLDKFGYKDRFAFVKHQLRLVNVPWLTAVKNFPINTAPDLWDSPNAETCGLVFRRSTDPVDAVVRVARRYKEVPGGLE